MVGAAPAKGSVCVAGLFEQLKGDFRLGLKCHIRGDTGLLPPLLVIDPFLRQIHAVADRETGVVVGDKERSRVPAVVLLAKLAAILASHANGMLALLGDPVRRANASLDHSLIRLTIGDPGFDRSVLLNRRQGAQRSCVRKL
jgi:hypothetical protein